MMFDGIQTYCQFIGYPRSGHSLVGALLNAHPDALISHELDAVRLIRKGYDRAALFEAIRDWDARFGAAGRVDFGFNYQIEGAWQGELRSLKVIGDKKGGRSAWWFHDEPELLERLQETVAVPVRYIHITRSPWDNIATISLRGRTLEDALTWYIANAEAILGIKARLAPEAVLDLRHEALVADPEGGLFALADHLGLERNARWAAACAQKIRPSPNLSRHRVDWTEDQKARVRAAIARLPWFGAEELPFEGAG